MNEFDLTLKFEKLKKIGFSTVPDCDLSYSFGSLALALDAKMLVRGDHASDCAYIYYAVMKNGDDIYEGLFFSPSILEHPTLNYQTYDISHLLDEINNCIGSEAIYLPFGAFPMIFIEVTEYSFTLDLRDEISDMLKIIGITDYFFSREFNDRTCNK